LKNRIFIDIYFKYNKILILIISLFYEASTSQPISDFNLYNL